MTRSSIGSRGGACSRVPEAVIAPRRCVCWLCKRPIPAGSHCVTQRLEPWHRRRSYRCPVEACIFLSDDERLTVLAGTQLLFPMEGP